MGKFKPHLTLDTLTAIHKKSRTPSPLRPATHPLPVGSKGSSRYKKPSKSSSRSRKGEGHIPRPKNAFIIFRRWYGEQLRNPKGKEEEKFQGQEKDLSKLAGTYWRSLADEQRDVFKGMAQAEARQHAIEHPTYKYRPKRGSSRRRKTTGASRNDMVKKHMEESISQERSFFLCGSEEYDQCESPLSCTPSPGSDTFSAPTPPDEYPAHTLNHRRSMSLPHIPLNEPYPFSRTYFLEPASCASSPGVTMHRPQRRYSSMSQESDLSSVPPPDMTFDIDYGFDLSPYILQHDMSPSTLSLPDSFSLSTFDSYQEQCTAIPSPQEVPQLSAAEPDAHAEFILPPQPVQHQPLSHRRQRSNTVPASMPPLAAVSSSLSNWNGSSGFASASTSCLPEFVFESEPTFPSHAPDIQFSSVPYLSSDGSAFDGPTMFFPGVGIDMDRTPRRSDFPADVHGSYPPPYNGQMNIYPSSIQADVNQLQQPGATYALDSYVTGLDDLGIRNHSPFNEMPDFGDFFHLGPA